ncbi:MAG: HAD family phosphatase [Myxococcota bacterium]
MIEAAADAPWILPNLGAEEGRDWAAYPSQSHARVCARLFALLLPAQARLLHRGPGGRWFGEPAAAHWPACLGEPDEMAVAPWLAPQPPEAIAWLNTRALANALAAGGPDGRPARLAGPAPALVETLHDKGFALAAARALALHPAALDPLIHCLEPEALADTDRTIARLEAALAAWPAWTQGRFTLKPRHGSSGRGRVGGQGRVDTPALRGALARLARCGGALFEPWLERTRDLSVALHVAKAPGTPAVLASFELIATPSGVYRGHLGRLSAKGEAASGDPEDDRLRAGAAAVAARARDAGYFGPCGVDAFRYRAAGGEEAWRGAVELNARPTMGLVVWGLLERVRARGAARPARGAPLDGKGFLFALFDAQAEARARAVLARAGDALDVFDLGSPRARADDPLPRLCFSDDAALLRALARAATDGRVGRGRGRAAGRGSRRAGTVRGLQREDAKVERTAVLFDLGGVVLGSPLQAIRAYGASLGYAPDAINRVVARTAPTGAWSRLERGELALEPFYAEFEADCRIAGLVIDARHMMARMADASAPCPAMLEAIRRLRAAGFRAGALTNNWAQAEPTGTRDGTRALRGHFDLFIESSVEGLRKPDPALYRLACERLGVTPQAVIFLDDIGANLKPARTLGMATIKVEEPMAALAELSQLVGLDLIAAPSPT